MVLWGNMSERSAERRRQKIRERRASAPNKSECVEGTHNPSIPVETPRGGVRLIPLTLGLVALDLFSRRYDIHHIELLSSYGHDFLGPAGWWLCTQGFVGYINPKIEFFRSRKNIFLATGLSFAFEGLQYLAEQKTQNIFEMGGNKYVYDPNDLLVYTLGTVAALGLHRMLYGTKGPNKPN